MSKHRLGTGSEGASTGFFAKIKDNYGSKFSNLSLNNNFEKDGSSEDDTLIHRAFVKYYTEKGEPFPEWLGVKQQQQQQGYQSYPTQDYSNSQYQPVRQTNTYNNSYSHQQAQQQASQEELQFEKETTPPPPQRPIYQGRSSSRLQDMYNRSKQQSVPGQGYNSQAAQPAARSNSTSVSGSRLRERMLKNSPSMTQIYQQQDQSQGQGQGQAPAQSNTTPKATWGRR